MLACDQELLRLANVNAGLAEQQGCKPPGLGGNGSGPVAVYRCHALFPEPGKAPHYDSFKATLAGLDKGLVSHFRDALSALTVPHLYRQLQQLPACAVEALLRSDDFGTDCESTVLLMLACWIDTHGDAISAAQREKLCELVRLSHLSRDYAAFVLPHCEWFDIGTAELCFLQRYLCAQDENERDMLLSMSGEDKRSNLWFTAPARRQVVPADGRTATWRITQQQLLEQGLTKVEDGVTVGVAAQFADCEGLPAFHHGPSGKHVLAHGLLWAVSLNLDPRELTKSMGAAAGIGLVCRIPNQLGAGAAEGPMGLNALLTVYSSSTGGRRKQRKAGCSVPFHPTEPAGLKGWRGGAGVLKLAPVAAASVSGDVSEGAAPVMQLSRWLGWLQDGEITGAFTFKQLWR